VTRPNILFLMTDQQRFDTIAALGNPHIYTPNLDRLVRRGVSFTKAYSSCPVCVPARYNIRTGREMPTLGVYKNGGEDLVEGQCEDMERRCGVFLGRRMGQLGYRTFGIGKFHSRHNDLGYETFLRAEELFGSPEGRALADGGLRRFPFEARPLRRIGQMAADRGAHGFPDHPKDVLDRFASGGGP